MSNSSTVTVNKNALTTLTWFSNMIPQLEQQTGRKIATASFSYDGTNVTQSIEFVDTTSTTSPTTTSP